VGGFLALPSESCYNLISVRASKGMGGPGEICLPKLMLPLARVFGNA
jgi:hypothetical protein